MEPLLKRQRLSNYGPADVNLRRKRAQNDQRLKSIFESIFQKYEREFDDIGDVINLETGKIEIDNGHIYHMRHEKDVGVGLENSSDVAASSALSEDEDSDSAGNLTLHSARDGCNQHKAKEINHKVWSDAGSTASSIAKVQNPAFNSKTAIPGKTYDEFEDELSIDKYGSTRPYLFLHEEKSAWQLPYHNTTCTQETGSKTTWSTPSFLTECNFLKARPLHRRFMPSPLKELDTRGIEEHAFGGKASLWAVEPKRRGCSRLRRTKHASRFSQTEPQLERPSHLQSLTASEQEKLCYLKTYTNLAYHEIIKYFPGYDQQSLLDHWNEAKANKQARKQTEHRDCLNYKTDSAPLTASIVSHVEKRDRYVSDLDPLISASLNSTLSPTILDKRQDSNDPSSLKARDIDSTSLGNKSNSHIAPQERSKQGLRFHNSYLDGKPVIAHNLDSSPRLPEKHSQNGETSEKIFCKVADNDPLAESLSPCPDEQCNKISSSNNHQSSQRIRLLRESKNMNHTEQPLGGFTHTEGQCSVGDVAGSPTETEYVVSDSTDAVFKQNSHSSAQQGLLAPASVSPQRQRFADPDKERKKHCKKIQIRKPLKNRDKVSVSQQRHTPNQVSPRGHYAGTVRANILPKVKRKRKHMTHSLESKGIRQMQTTGFKPSGACDSWSSREIPSSQLSRRTSSLFKCSANSLGEDEFSQKEFNGNAREGRLMRSGCEHDDIRHISHSSIEESGRRKSDSVSTLSSQEIVQNQLLVAKSRPKTTLLPKTKITRKASEISFSQLCDDSDDDLSICLTKFTPKLTPKASTHKPTMSHMLPSMDSQGIGQVAKTPGSKCKRIATIPKITKTLPQAMANCSDDELA